MVARYLIFIPFCFLHLFGLGQKVVDQSVKKKPVWIDQIPRSDLFTYYKSEGTGVTIDEAAKISQINVYSQIAAKANSRVTAEYGRNVQSTEEYNDTSANIKEVIEFKAVTNVKNDTLSFDGLRCEDKYWILREYKDGSYKYEIITLWRLPKFPHVDPNKEAPKEYTLSEISYRMLVPGWGQLYKHEWGKGYTLLISETLLLGTAATAQYFYADNYDLATKNKGVSQNKYETYKANYEDWEKVRNFSALAFAGVYIYSIIDVITARGEMRFAYKPRKLEIIPIAGKKQTGFLLAYRF